MQTSPGGSFCEDGVYAIVDCVSSVSLVPCSSFTSTSSTISKSCVTATLVAFLWFCFMSDARLMRRTSFLQALAESRDAYNLQWEIEAENARSLWGLGFSDSD